MKKRQRLKWEIAAATRLNALGAARTADLNIIKARQNITTAGIGGMRSLGLGYSGGDYWV